ncbi:MAG TPA: hypothetical protein VM553_16210 [Dongiaceae bacterium]|nr:hypothetical protein [Dongiaceae bacterium]
MFRRVPLRSLLLPALALVSTLAVAAGTWTTRWEHGDLMAITPNHKMVLRMDLRPSQAVWGELLVPIKAEQVQALNKFRKVPEFPYIEVAVEVDGYHRSAQGHIFVDELYVSTELDVRQWEGMKKGSKLIVRLPDGTEYKEPLNGSGHALQEVEKRYH